MKPDPNDTIIAELPSGSALSELLQISLWLCAELKNSK